MTVPDPVSAADFFTAGGTLRYDTPSYVEREADETLFQAALNGRFCYVLTPRQMGKSSLMVRTARRLQEVGVGSAIIDLTAIGTEVTPDQWYLGLISRLNSRLRLRLDVQRWWNDRTHLPLVQRFTDFLQKEILRHTPDRVVIFVDEIDITLSLAFTDDFFAAIRAIYNARAEAPELERLTFVLLGVATPADLIKDRTRTPFNVGEHIELPEFTRADARILEQGLEAVYPGQGAVILDRIFYWTNGHPYLTQRLCLAAIEEQRAQWTDADIDALVGQRFLSESARRETNLQFIRDNVRLLPSGQRRQLLQVYRQVLQLQTVEEDERSFVQNQLKLLGLVRAENGRLTVRNHIYRRVFDHSWVRQLMPPDWTRRLALGSVGVVVLLVLVLGWVVRNQQQQTTETIIAQYETQFLNTTNPTVRLSSLDQLFSWNDEASINRAYELFADLPQQGKLALLNDSDVTGLEFDAYTVARNLSLQLTHTPANDEVLAALEAMLRRTNESDALLYAAAVAFWRQGREALAAGEYATAVSEYGNALDIFAEHPAFYVERALAQAALGNYEAALHDLDTGLTPETYQSWPAEVMGPALAFWRGEVETVVFADPPIMLHWYRQQAQNPDDYPQLQSLAWPTRVPGADVCEPNNTVDTACTIGEDEIFQLGFVPSLTDPDIDVFRFQVKQDTTYTCETFDLSSVTDTRLTFLDEEGNAFQPGLENDDKAPGDRGSEISWQATYSGWLLIVVEQVLPPRYEESPLYTYSLECTSVVVTPTPVTTATPTFEASSPTSTSTVAPSQIGENCTPLDPMPTPDGKQRDATFVADVTIPDNTIIPPDTAFTKTWRIRNRGETTWSTGYCLVFVGGDSVILDDTFSVPVPRTEPGETVDIAVSLRSPSAPGEYSIEWRLYDSRGTPFGDTFWVRIVVVAETSE